MVKVKVEKIEKHTEGPFYLTIWFKIGGELLRTKLTREHLINLRNKDKIPKKLMLGQLLHVCKRKGRGEVDLYYIYAYDK